LDGKPLAISSIQSNGGTEPVVLLRQHAAAVVKASYGCPPAGAQKLALQKVAPEMIRRLSWQTWQGG
jgi:hypothetical protein